MTSTKALMTDQAAAVGHRAPASEPGIGPLGAPRSAALPTTGPVYLVATGDGHDPAFADDGGLVGIVSEADLLPPGAGS
jgi:hypothetical protein